MLDDGWGAGVGVSTLSTHAVPVDLREPVTTTTSSDDTTKFEWSAFFGANFTRRWYVEFCYAKPADWYGTDVGTYSAMLGVRF